MASSTVDTRSTHSTRIRWAAIGAAVAVSMGAGGLIGASASISSGERSTFVPITPCRIIDTRPEGTVGSRSAPLAGGQSHTVSVVGSVGGCSLPADATALVLNVTAIAPTAAGFLTVYPEGDRPVASSLNWSAGEPAVPNAVTVDVPASGKVSFFTNAGSVHLAVDVNGYYVDHNHDDRYYTRSETDTRTMIAKVGPDGTLRSGSVGVAATKTGTTGYYEVAFPRDIATCVFTGEALNAQQGRRLSLADNPFDSKEVSVFVYNAAGTAIAEGFSVVVNCP